MDTYSTEIFSKKLKNATRHDAVFLKINKKWEELNCAWVVYKRPIGAVIRAIETADMNSCQKLRDSLKELRTCVIKLSLNEAAERTREAISAAISNEMLISLVTYLPIYSRINIATQEFMQSSFSDSELEEILINLKLTHGDGSFELSEMQKARRSEAAKPGGEEMRWDLWRAFLSRIDLEKEIWPEEKERIKNEIVTRYFDDVIRLTHEIDKLRLHIPLIAEAVNNQTITKEIRWIMESLPGASQMWLDNESCAFTKSADFSELYRCVSLLSLLAVEIQAIWQLKRKICNCAQCGHSFVPYSKNARFCRYPNPQYDEKSCQSVGRTLQWAINTKNDDVLRTFERNRGSYWQWKSRNTSIKRNKGIEISKPIKDEIDNIYLDWHKRTTRAIDAYKNKSISAEQCIEKIMLPSITDRSPLLAKEKAYARGDRSVIDELDKIYK